jgi:hypothetical protein
MIQMLLSLLHPEASLQAPREHFINGSLQGAMPNLTEWSEDFTFLNLGEIVSLFSIL